MVEILRRSTDSLVTSEYAKNWTENSPKSKLGNINVKLNNPRLQRLNEIKELKNKIRNREYRSFQKMVGVPYSRCDGKLGGESLSYFDNYLNKLKQQNNMISQTSGSLNSLQYDVGQIGNITDTINIQHHEAQYLSSHETMSQSEYNRLFSGKERLQQGDQFGDCYLVSGINELARAQHFDTLMRTSIQRVTWRDGSGSGYQIKIPLGEPTGRKILLKDSELSVAKIKGNIGYKLLELSYAKNKLRKNDRNGNRYYPITSGEFSKIRGGRTKEVLETFLGKQNISFNTFGDKKRKRTLAHMSALQKSQIEGFLKNYVPSVGNKFLSLSSIGGDDTNGYNVGKNRIQYGHAYSITKINKDKRGNIKTITILNPRNNNLGAGNNYQNLTLNELFEGFTYMSCGKIKTRTFLDNKGVS